jgi:hypothetical protein
VRESWEGACCTGPVAVCYFWCPSSGSPIEDLQLALAQSSRRARCLPAAPFLPFLSPQHSFLLLSLLEPAGFNFKHSITVSGEHACAHIAESNVPVGWGRV